MPVIDLPELQPAIAKHAARIASAFRHNQQLLILDLSWNSPSNDAAMHLADALRGNRSLTNWTSLTWR